MKKIAAFICAAICIAACTQSPKATEGSVKVGSALQVHYHRTGTGKAIILLHAGLQESNMWAEQVVALAPNYEVISIDQPSHGKTTGIDTITLIADVIKVVMDSLHIQKASVMGLSMGSVSAIDFALVYPKMMDKLILVSPGLNGWQAHFTMDSVSRNYLDTMDMLMATNNAENIAKQFVKTWCDGPYRQPSEVKASVRDYIYHTSVENIRTHHLTGFPVFAIPPAAGRLGNINCPTLIIYGDKDLGLISAASKVLHQSIKGSQLTTFPNVAHMLNMEIPAAFNDALLKFLKE